MGAAAGPDLISNGLVLMLDVANVKSCQGESTVNYYPCLGTSGYGASADNAVTFPYQGVGGFIRLGYGQTFGNYNILNTDVVYKYNLGTLDCHYHGDAFAIPSGSYLTFTFDYYISSDATNVTGSLLAAIENYGGGALSNGMYMQNTTQGIWQSVTQTSGPTSSSGTQAIYLYPGGCGTKIADTGFILFKNVQVELKSYKTPFVNGTRNTISDISGNKKNHTMVNTPIYSDGPPKFTLDETNGFSYPAAITTSTTCTVVIYYKTTDVTELWIRGNQNNAWYLSASSNGAYYHAACGSPTNYIDLNSASNPYAEGYKDGNYHMFEAKNVDLSNWTYYEWFLYPAPWQLAGSVSMIMVYNRNLTATESAQNFNALKNRYMPLGSIAAMAANSAQDIKARYPSAPDGVYWINLPTVGPTQIYCIMDSAYDGGGWMMMMKAATGTTFNYDANYWTTTNTLNPTDLTQNNADAKYNTMNYYSGKDLMARWPDISQGGSIAGVGAWTWLENNFNNGSNVIPINFFASPSSMNRYYSGAGTYGGSGNFIKDAKTYSGWVSGVFSSQVDIRFYGFNYASYGGGVNRVRWGFGWNENGEGLFPCTIIGGAPGSNDLSGGIGMDSNNRGGYSAGDSIGCCADTTGINRSARVEVYIR